MYRLVKRYLTTILALFKRTEIRIALAAAMVLSLVPLHFGRYDRVAGAIADAGHFWFYFVAYLYLNGVLNNSKRLILGLVLISGAIEIVQPFFDRDGNFQDFAVSSLGALSGYLFNLQYRLGLRVMIVSVFSMPLFFPIYWRYDALRYQERLFPEFASFNGSRSVNLWEATSPDGSSSSTLYVPPESKLVVRALSGKEWPGVVYLNQFLSWSGYNALELEVESFEDLNLSIRVDDDQRCKEYNDRFNKGFLLKEGSNKIRIPFEELRMTRSGRMLNLEKIKRVVLFTTSRERPERLFAVTAMRLVK